MNPINNLSAALLISFLTLLSPRVGHTTLSDYDYLKAQIAPYKMSLSGSSNTEDSDESIHPTFDQIKSYFNEEQSYQSLCFTEDDHTTDWQTLAPLIPDHLMKRNFDFKLLPKRFGFDLRIAYKLNQESPLFTSQSNLANCAIQGNLCITISTKETSDVVVINENEFTKKEAWSFYILPSGELLAEAAYTLTGTEEDFLGRSKVIAESTKNFICYLDPLTEAETQTPSQ